MKSFIFAVLFFTLTLSFQLVAAQRYTYTTSVVTECFSSTQTNFVAPQATPTQGSDGYYTVSMPECRDCGCTDCAFTNTYTSTYQVFGPSGTQVATYSVKEVYKGMNTTVDGGSIPYGFETDVQTCTSGCGKGAVTATLTYPRGQQPYATSMTNVPTGVPANPTTLVPVPAATGGSSNKNSGNNSNNSNNSNSNSNSNDKPGASRTYGASPTSTDDPLTVTGAASRPSLGGAWLALIIPLVMLF